MIAGVKGIGDSEASGTLTYRVYGEFFRSDFDLGIPESPLMDSP
ncbi:MAG: hypothetical protein ACI9R3_006545, partial [Verrucomicrobiales bacterium]